jgi:insulysin
MAHTKYHFKVHSSALPGALDRMAHMLAAPLLCEEAVGREVENVHSEFSRNCNSDSRRLLQLRRSLGRWVQPGHAVGRLLW